jgi:hypothetical protein
MCTSISSSTVECNTRTEREPFHCQLPAWTTKLRSQAIAPPVTSHDNICVTVTTCVDRCSFEQSLAYGEVQGIANERGDRCGRGGHVQKWRIPMAFSQQDRTVMLVVTAS